MKILYEREESCSVEHLNIYQSYQFKLDRQKGRMSVGGPGIGRVYRWDGSRGDRLVNCRLGS